MEVSLDSGAYGRKPGYGPVDSAWIERWVADYKARLCRQDPEYAHRFAIRQTWRARRRAALTGAVSTFSPAAATATSQ